MMFIHALLLAAGPLEPSASVGYDETVAEIAALDEAINVGEPVRDELADALARLPSYAPRLAADPAAQEVRVRALLNLARTHLADGESERAAELVDEALRSTLGEELEVDDFGPSLAALHAERRAELAAAGVAGIQVTCAVPCRVYVNERASTRRADDLYLGMYRIWIEAEGEIEGVEPRVEWVRLTQANELYRVDYRPARRFEPSPTNAPARERIMPKAAELSLLIVGGGVVTMGALLLGVPADGGRAESRVGATLTGIGGAALLLGGVTLGVDEVRLGKARGHQATLNWRMRF